MPDQSPDDVPQVPRVGPDHRDLYLIVVGIVLGVLLGPAVMGRVSPATYNKLFRGGVSEQLAIQKYDSEQEKLRERLSNSGATEGVALEEFNARPRDERIVLLANLQKAQQAHRSGMMGRNVAIILALLALMLVETLVDPSQLAIRGRLATARYALLAIWLALMLAAPSQFLAVPRTFLAGLVIMALVAALVPMGRRKAA